MSTFDLDKVAASLSGERGWSLKRRLGSGAFKVAYLAERGDGQFALKLTLSADSIERLARETSALRDCDHPCIAKLIDAFAATHDGAKYWVTLEEFLPGGTLDEAMRKGAIDVALVRHLAISLGDVLRHLEGKKLVHRDIKPANILFASDGRTPVLTDFGIVRMLDQPSLTRDFLAGGPGTPAYAAPEQLNNQKSLIDWRTDQFGLALVLAECLLGRHAFALEGEHAHAGIAKVASQQQLPEINKRALQDLGFTSLVKALGPWPVQRYRYPIDFVRELENER